jgi:hypothetical protein
MQLIFVPVVYAADKGQPVKPYKCYLVYVGGGDGIHYIHTDKGKEFAYQYFAGKTLAVSTTAKNATVYKVSECVAQEKKFKLGRAQQIESKQIR